jgi:hypothetical protein
VSLSARRYMRDVPIYQELIGHADLGREGSQGSRQPRRRHTVVRGTRPWAWALIGGIVTLTVVVAITPAVRHSITPPRFAWFRSQHTVTPPRPRPQPVYAAPWPKRPIVGKRTLFFGNRLLLDGPTSRFPDKIRLRIRWNHGRWRIIASADDWKQPRFHFSVYLTHHGTLDVEVIQHGFSAVGTYHVIDRPTDGSPVT